nr:immunoglobulin heavy chain junction region [Macaca mulatta]MOY22995.1 immunoglobulin heavy chain junction region [Macaca mulatta]MOY23075.1 immunoglobulin heavy chain junction region [Macaca mulatta]MOY23279.1 immunoglobulin heavy chain junction region [Macaca mulatta]MOY23404.1 immunoglobulin heavy chain junction region [Macaca mulatta]
CARGGPLAWGDSLDVW